MKLAGVLEREPAGSGWSADLDVAAQAMLGGYPGHTIPIAPDAEPEDAEVEDSLRRALEVRLGLPGSVVQAEVAHGWVTIRGHLHSWGEWQSVEAAALSVTGVRGVDDRAIVEEVGESLTVHP